MKSLYIYLLGRKAGLRASAGPIVVSALLFAFTNIASAQSFSEGFDSVASNTAAPLPNWTAINRSTSVGALGWFQGSIPTDPPPSGPFYAHSPENTRSYIGANFNNATGASTISNWLISPMRTFRNGDTISFYTRTVNAPVYADRLEVRLSQNASSANVGGSDTSVGDFTTLLLSVNPTLAPSGYPSSWTQFTITLSGLPGPTSGRFAFRYFVTNGGPDGLNSDFIGIDTLTYTSTAPQVRAPVDYNGDGKTDWSVVRNTGGGVDGQITWYNCINGVAEPGCLTYTQFGLASDFFVPVDFDGDSKTDIAVWRPGASGVAAFYILQSSNNTFYGVPFGQNEDNPTVVADYTGDGKADPAVFRRGAGPGSQGYWYYLASSGPYTGGLVYEQWGTFGDYVSPGDYDGDGKADFVVQRDGGSGQAIFFVRTNTTNVVSAYSFGLPTDVVVPGDYDGDGKNDIAVVRGVNGVINWYYLSSMTGNVGYLGGFGLSARDKIVPGDYDGDGKADLAVWRPDLDPAQTRYYVLNSGSGTLTVYKWGVNGDYPVANYNVH